MSDDKTKKVTRRSQIVCSTKPFWRTVAEQQPLPVLTPTASLFTVLCPGQEASHSHVA